MFKESFPVIDPLTAGHKAADKILEKKRQQGLEADADQAFAFEQEAKNQEIKEREEVYEKDPDEEWYKK